MFLSFDPVIFSLLRSCAIFLSFNPVLFSIHRDNSYISWIFLYFHHVYIYIFFSPAVDTLGMILRILAVSWIVWSIIWRQYCGAWLETGVDHYCMSYTAISVSPHRRVFAMRLNCASTVVDHYCKSYTTVSVLPLCSYIGWSLLQVLYYSICVAMYRRLSSLLCLLILLLLFSDFLRLLILLLPISCYFVCWSYCSWLLSLLISCYNSVLTVDPDVFLLAVYLL